MFYFLFFFLHPCIFEPDSIPIPRVDGRYLTMRSHPIHVFRNGFAAWILEVSLNSDFKSLQSHVDLNDYSSPPPPSSLITPSPSCLFFLRPPLHNEVYRPWNNHMLSQFAASFYTSISVLAALHTTSCHKQMHRSSGSRTVRRETKAKRR